MDTTTDRGWIPALFTALLAAAILAYMLWQRPAAPPPIPAVEACPTAPPDDSWVLRRLEACDKVCGPVPMEITATRDSIACTCGRPEKLKPMRLPVKGG
jgi:hypothetical protein